MIWIRNVEALHCECSCDFSDEDIIEFATAAAVAEDLPPLHLPLSQWGEPMRAAAHACAIDVDRFLANDLEPGFLPQALPVPDRPN